MKTLLTILIILLPQLVMSDAYATNCLSKWESVSSTATNNKDALKKWLAVKDVCSGSGIWEYKLGSLYYATGNKDKAITLYEKTLSKTTPYQHLIILSLNTLYFINLVEEHVSDVTQYKEVEENLQKLAYKHSNWSPAYAQLSYVQVFINKTEAAILNAKKAISLDSSSWMAYRTLVIAHTNKKQYLEAKKYITKSIKLDESLLAETEFMYASAISYMRTGDLDTAEALLAILSQKSPEVKKDPMFLKIVSELKTKQNNNKS